MTEVEASLCDQKYRSSFFEQTTDILEINDSGKECNNIMALTSKEERAALLKAGFTGKDIESQYLRLNGIKVVGINWRDSN